MRYDQWCSHSAPPTPPGLTPEHHHPCQELLHKVFFSTTNMHMFINTGLQAPSGSIPPSRWLRSAVQIRWVRLLTTILRDDQAPRSLDKLHSVLPTHDSSNVALMQVTSEERETSRTLLFPCPQITPGFRRDPRSPRKTLPLPRSGQT